MYVVLYLHVCDVLHRTQRGNQVKRYHLAPWASYVQRIFLRVGPNLLEQVVHANPHANSSYDFIHSKSMWLQMKTPFIYAFHRGFQRGPEIQIQILSSHLETGCQITALHQPRWHAFNWDSFVSLFSFSGRVCENLKCFCVKYWSVCLCKIEIALNNENNCKLSCWP